MIGWVVVLVGGLLGGCVHREMSHGRQKLCPDTLAAASGGLRRTKCLNNLGVNLIHGKCCECGLQLNGGGGGKCLGAWGLDGWRAGGGDGGGGWTGEWVEGGLASRRVGRWRAGRGVGCWRTYK